MMTPSNPNTAMTKTWMAWCLALLAAAVITANPAHAGVGLAELPGQQGDGPVTVFYPAQEADQPVQRGPFALQLAWQGTPAPGNGRLVMVSHGSGGNPWVHTDLARELLGDPPGFDRSVLPQVDASTVAFFAKHLQPLKPATPSQRP